MDFAFTPEDEIFRRSVREFAVQRLLPDYRRWDRGEALPREIIGDMASRGFTKLRLPADYGGEGASFIQCGIAAEELSRGDPNVAMLILNPMVVGEIAHLLREEFKGQWLPKIANGAVVGVDSTEPMAGSDAAQLRTTARLKGDYYEVNGEKSSASFTGFMEFSIMFVRTGPSGSRGISCIVVPMDLSGISRQVYRSPGGRATQRGSVFLDDVRVPALNLVGEEGAGFNIMMQQFDFLRPLLGLMGVGAALKSLEETVEYVKQRQAFGQPIAKFEGVSFELAENFTMVEAARLMAYKAFFLKDQGQPIPKEGAMAKWLCIQAALSAIHSCIVLHGHYGYSEELPLELRLRDVLGYEIAEAPPQILKLIISREILGRGFLPHA